MFRAIRKAINSTLPELDIKYPTDKRSYYKKHLNIVSIRKDASPDTFAHEVFHAIDKKHRITKNSYFLSALQNDWQNIIDESGGNVIEYLRRKFTEAFIINRVEKPKLKWINQQQKFVWVTVTAKAIGQLKASRNLKHGHNSGE